MKSLKEPLEKIMVAGWYHAKVSWGVRQSVQDCALLIHDKTTSISVPIGQEITKHPGFWFIELGRRI
jgi:hypothetical protein